MKMTRTSRLSSRGPELSKWLVYSWLRFREHIQLHSQSPVAGSFWTPLTDSCRKMESVFSNSLVMEEFNTFRLNHRDLQPNIGLFWYFFTEMFEHFRTLFLIAFQMNATILYLVPLTIKLHKQPIFLATVITALTSIFRSYPCVGDVAFYISLFPLWKESAKRKRFEPISNPSRL